MGGKRHGGQKTGGQKAWGAKGRVAKDRGAKDRGAKDRGAKDRGAKVLSPSAHSTKAILSQKPRTPYIRRPSLHSAVWALDTTAMLTSAPPHPALHDCITAHPHAVPPYLNMATRRRWQTAATDTTMTGTDSQGRLNDIPKPKKPTVAQNAQAIASLTDKISGVDSQLASMNQLLAQIAASSSKQPEPPQNVSAIPPQHFTAEPPLVPTVQPGACAAPTATSPPLDHDAAYDMASCYQLTSRSGLTAPAYPCMTGQRSRHNTTGQFNPPPPTPWHAHHGFTPRTPAGAPPAPTAGQQHHNYLSAHRHPWDHPVNLQDMETDSQLIRCVTEALQAATPFNAVNGKHAQFSHHLITRGPKKQKTNLGELSLAEYM